MTAPSEPTAPDDLQRLARDLAEAVEHQAATSDVIEVMGLSRFELEPVFDTVVQHAVRLCGADSGQVWQLEGDLYRLTCCSSTSPEYRRLLEENPIARGSGTMVGLVGSERRTVQIEDARSDPRYQWQEALALGELRTILGVPMLIAGQAIGVIVLTRHQVDPFDDRTIGLVTTFAQQGAIAIQNVQLFKQLQDRSGELTQSVGELEALGETSQAVSSSLDLQQVLTTIVTRAVELSGAEGGSIFEFDDETKEFQVRTFYGTSRPLVEALRATRIHLDETFVGRAAAAGEPRQAPDLALEPSDPHIDHVRAAGWRSMLAVPLLREHDIIGALVVRRRVVGGFSERTVDLMETFASQSAVAIHNARLFRELEEKTRQLEVAGAHKSEFLASMSHELRTPLNAVIGFSDVLLERMFGELNERQDEYLQDIRNSGRHLLELINEILDLSKVEAGRMELELGRVSLAGLLESSMTMVRERASDCGTSLRLELDPDLGVVWADELKLKQVVLNLLTNAVKATDQGTVVVAARVVGAEVEVTVSDTGVGIAESEQERIFEAFQRGGRDARRSSEGTGLGLTLSKRIIELHEGRLWVKSEVGIGSIFGFTIPIQPAAALSQAQGPAEGGIADHADPGSPILLIEDDPHSADLLTLYLEGAGLRVEVAADGVSGLHRARAIQPQAIILDVLLPALDGWTLLAELKADPATAAIPVVIVSMMDERGKGFALGAAEYLVKPVGRSQILDALAHCLPQADGDRTVVVIDDDPVDLDLVEAVLVPEGYAVVRAMGGEEGVRVVRRERPSLVIVDLLMPGVDGFEVVEQLRADPLTADVPIVVLTSKDMTRADQDRLAGQISHLAQKGVYGRSELVDLVARMTRTRGSVRAGDVR